MANEQNLRPCEYKLSKEEAKKGGINSAKARKRKKLLRESIDLLFNLPIRSSKTKEQLKALGIDDEEMNNQMALIIAMYHQALKGDVQAFNTLRDTAGQKPVEKVETTERPIIKDDI